MSRLLDCLGLAFLAAVWLVAYVAACPAAELGTAPPPPPLNALSPYTGVVGIGLAVCVAAAVIVSAIVSERGRR